MGGRQGRRTGWIVLVLLGLLGAGGATFAVLKQRSQDEPASPTSTPARSVAVTVEKVTVRPVRRTVRAVGSLFGSEEVDLACKVEGRVLKIHRDIGDRVRPGELLLEIDPTDYGLAVAEARRALELDLARLGLKEMPVGEFDLRTVPGVMRALTQEQNAAARLERVRQLGGNSSAEERDTAIKEFAVCQADSRTALLEARATLASARHKSALLDTALQKLRDTRVVVPGATPGLNEVAFDNKPSLEYVISKRSVAEGEIVRILPGESSSLFRLAIDRPLKLQAALPERHLGEVKQGQLTELRVAAFRGEIFPGKVARVNPTVDRSSRTFGVEVHIPNEKRRLSPGCFAKLTVITEIDQTALTVPEEAIVSFAGVSKLFVFEDNKVREVQVKVRPESMLEVTTGNGKRIWIEVTGELKPDQLVVTSGQSKLANGTRARLRDS